MGNKFLLILRRPRSGRLEGRTMLIQPTYCLLRRGGGGCTLHYTPRYW
jgi:hypothetical protein